MNRVLLYRSLPSGPAPGSTEEQAQRILEEIKETREKMEKVIDSHLDEAKHL